MAWGWTRRDAGREKGEETELGGSGSQCTRSVFTNTPAPGHVEAGLGEEAGRPGPQGHACTPQRGR